MNKGKTHPLNYYAPEKVRLQWKYLRGTATVLLFVFAWFLVSVYLRYFHDGGRGLDERARGIAAPCIWLDLFILTAINLALLAITVWRRRRFGIFSVYMLLAIIPILCLIVTEAFLGSRAVE